MKKILIYDTSIEGHHLEYIHHIYLATMNVDATFVFSIPEKYLALKDKMLWPKRDNVSFDLLPTTELRNIKRNYIKERWKNAQLAAKYIKKNSVDEVFFIELIVQFPFLPLFVSKKVKVSGILYRLVPYEWNRLSWLTKIKDVIEILVLVKSSLVKTAMCLNDNSCVCFYNKKFKTNRFSYVVDPVLPLDYNPIIRRDELGASNNDKVILHFGNLTERKGSLLLLEGACLIDDMHIKGKVFVFAGRVSEEIKDRFYKYVELLRKKARVLVFDSFCSFEFISDLCNSCDCIVVPYRNVSYSSGIIGYAAQFQKTVVGPNRGLLGKLIIRNKLGIVLKDITPEAVASILCSEKAFLPRPNKYSQEETVEKFNRTIIQALLN